MADIQGQAGVNLTQELADYLNTQNGNLNSTELAAIINDYLTGGNRLGEQGGQVATGVYRRFLTTDLVPGKIEVVTTGLWSGDTGSLTDFHTSSAQVDRTGDYYYNVYNTETTQSVQFAVAYGHRNNLGSVGLNIDDTATFPSKATYTQYRSILLEQDDDVFTFVSQSEGLSHDSDDIYVINVARSRYKEKLDPGNWSLTLSGSGGSVTLIDDSGKKFDDTVGKAGRVFNIGEGSLNLGTENEATVTSLYGSNGEGYGLFYPDQGLFILNPSSLADIDPQLTGSLDTGSEQRNHQYLWNAIRLGGDFEARRTENVSTSHYFVRATNREFNFSNNPTFTTGSDGSFTESTFERDPKTFITTVGLYNDNNELLAVAKTSQPIAKSFDKEVLIKVKLDF